MPDTTNGTAQNFRQGKRCRFTLNNPLSFRPDFSLSTELNYAIYQLEKGEQEGTEHLQGVLFFNKQVKAKHVNKTYFTVPEGHANYNVNGSAWLGKVNSAQGSIDYCSKEDTRVDGPWEHGDRSLVVEARSHALSSARFYDSREALVNDLAAQSNYSNIMRQHNDRQLLKKREWHTRFLCLYGATRLGKSQLFKKIQKFIFNPLGYRVFPIQKCHSSSKSAVLWFDGYDGEEVMFVDDYANTFSITVFKDLVNDSVHRLPVKGGKVPMLAKYVVVLSNSDPRTTWWPNVPEYHKDAAMARMREQQHSLIIHIDRPLVIVRKDPATHDYSGEWQPFARTVMRVIHTWANKPFADLSENNEAIVDPTQALPQDPGTPATPAVLADTVPVTPASPLYQPPSPSTSPPLFNLSDAEVEERRKRLCLRPEPEGYTPPRRNSPATFRVLNRTDYL